MNNSRTISPEEQQFLDNYDITHYARPSVTVDDVVITFAPNNRLAILLAKRAQYPYKNYWALPGGFLRTGSTIEDRESSDEAVIREVAEETSLDTTNLYKEQLYTYTSPNRDPRGHVITIAYLMAIPTKLRPTMHEQGGDDVKEAKWFTFINSNTLKANDKETIKLDNLAFDHADIIRYAIKRIADKIMWTDIATYFVGDGNTFTIPQLRTFCETILSLNDSTSHKLDPGNFHRDYRRFVERDPNGQYKGPRKASLYRRKSH